MIIEGRDTDTGVICLMILNGPTYWDSTSCTGAEG